MLACEGASVRRGGVPGSAAPDAFGSPRAVGVSMAPDGRARRGASRLVPLRESLAAAEPTLKAERSASERRRAVDGGRLGACERSRGSSGSRALRVASGAEVRRRGRVPPCWPELDCPSPAGRTGSWRGRRSGAADPASALRASGARACKGSPAARPSLVTPKTSRAGRCSSTWPGRRHVRAAALRRRLCIVVVVVYILFIGIKYAVSKCNATPACIF